MASNVPAKIGKYDVVEIIGRGGMGVVYKAVDPHLDRQVAIKMMTSGFGDNPDLLKRFFREAQSLGSLQHPNIVTVYDLGDFGGNPYMVMEYMEGEALDSVLAARRQLSLLEKTNIIIQVCNGLSYAHRRGVVHRDIKPANIMLAKDGSVRLFDFGIAHIGDNSVTKTGQIVGTLSYMSPEQVNGKAVDARTDLFSTGVVLYQLLTNHLPFEGESTATTLLKIIYDPPPPLKNFLAAYPPELEVILLRALAKDREERYHSADELALDLSQLQIQLKQELISQHMHEVTQFLEKSDLYKAKEYLVQVLKVDQQHAQATQLLREVQLRIKKEEIGEQVRKLRQRAEEAAARELFDAAQESVDQAIALDKTNADLIRLRESIKAAALRAQKLHSAIRQAETSHQDGDLDTAKQAIEEALQIAPDDPQAKTLYRVIQRDWVERSRQRQLENYLFEARQDISSRKFTAALEILKLAEALDPKAPQVHALIESAAAGRDQERRRKDLEAISREIEDALNRDDYRSACQRADEGLVRFPEERTLLKLKALADRQRQTEERKQFIDEQLAHARKLLQEGRNAELLVALEGAIAKIGAEPRLQSLISIVTENVQRERLERRKAEYLQKAKEALRNKQYESAIRTLESARSELKNEPEIDDLLHFVRDEAAADQRRRAAEAAAQKAHGFVAEQKYEEAIRLLETALREAPDEELRIVLAETRRAAVDYQQKLETTVNTAEKLLQARKPNEALNLLESQPAAYFRHPSLAKLLEVARRDTERLRRIDDAIERSRRVLDEEDFSSARRVLEECRQSHGTSPELEAQLARIEEKRVTAASRKVEKAIGDARILTMATEYQAALDKLQSVKEFAEIVAAPLRSEYRALQQQNSAGLIHVRKTQIERFAAAGDLTRATDLLRQSLDQFPGDRDLLSLNSVLNQESARRSEAKDKLVEAQKAFARSRWREGGELLQKAFAASSRAPVVREQVLDAFVQAGVSAVEADWRAAEALLQQLSQLNADYATPSVLRSRIRERKREEFVSQCVTQGKRLLSNGELQAAAREVKAGLTTYPDDASLKALQDAILERIRQEEDRAREERARMEREAFLRDVSSRIEREPALDRRITILDEALARYPQESRLQQLSVTTRELWKQVSAMAAEATALETSGKYDEALSQWNALRTLHRQHPEVDNSIARVTRLREQARTATKASWIEKLQQALTSSELERARALLLEARREFPGDRELSRLEEQLGDAVKLRSKAQKLLAESGKAFEQARWDKGIDTVGRALESASRDVVVRDQAIAQLAKACQAALATNLNSAQLLADRIASLQSGSPLIPGLRNKIEERKREQAIVQRLASARRAQLGADLQGALRELSLGLAAYPGDQRFIQAKSEIETQLHGLEEQRKQEREKAHQLELERERERERSRQEERERQRVRAEEEEGKRKEALEREKLRAQEEERERQEALERERQAAAERERIRALEEERKRKEELEQERQRALEREAERERERKRLEALEQERVKIEQKEREQARLKALELEREREQARQRELEAEKERQAAEKRRLEEAQRLRAEELRKEEERRRERELARQREREEKEKEKAHKREQRQRKQAAAEEERRKQKEAEQQREEERRREAQKAREREAAELEKKRAQEEAEKRARAEVPPPSSDVSATMVFGPAAPPETRPAIVEQVEKEVAPAAAEESAAHFSFAALSPGTKRAVIATSGVALLLVAILVWRALQPRAIAIQITTTPDGAAVTLYPSGNPSRKRECTAPRCSFDLVAGTYSLEARHEGYETAQQTVAIAASGPHSFPIVLSRSAPPPPPPPSLSKPQEQVRLEVRGVPAGGELFVDGTSAGKIGRNGEISTKVALGQHQIKIVAKNQNSSIVSRNFEVGRVVSLGKDDFYPPKPPTAEEIAWQTALGAPTIDSIEQFLQKYQNGTHDSDARIMLEDLYWKKASRANSAEEYGEYLRALGSYRLTRGPHADQVEEELAFLQVRNHQDLAALDAFLNKYPNSKHHKEVEALRDDVVWQHLDNNDPKALESYLRDSPRSRHADEARTQLAKVTPQPPPRPPQQAPLQPPPPKPVDERQAVLGVLERYKKAYEDENIAELKNVWPGMTDKSARATEGLFRTAKFLRLNYEHATDPQIVGDQATVNFLQTMSYVQDRKAVKAPTARVIMQLKKEASGIWVIESIR